MNKLFKDGDPDGAIKYLKNLIKIKNIKEHPFLKDKKEDIKNLLIILIKEKMALRFIKKNDIQVLVLNHKFLIMSND
ncbi:MAG: hypothetical protein CXB60_10410 [Spiroplasma poulsonii]|nr:hypothetical protein [Spiroplasma poulsonii]